MLHFGSCKCRQHTFLFALNRTQVQYGVVVLGGGGVSLRSQRRCCTVLLACRTCVVLTLYIRSHPHVAICRARLHIPYALGSIRFAVICLLFVCNGTFLVVGSAYTKYCCNMATRRRMHQCSTEKSGALSGHVLRG